MENNETNETKKAIPTEGTVTDAAEKKSWIRRMYENPKARKWAKRIGGFLVGLGVGVSGFAIGRMTAPTVEWQNMENLCEPDPETGEVPKLEEEEDEA